MRTTAGDARELDEVGRKGSEIRLTWPATVPATPGTVTAVSTDKIETQLSTGRKQTYRLARKGNSTLVPYVVAGDEFGGAYRPRSLRSCRS